MKAQSRFACAVSMTSLALLFSTQANAQASGSDRSAAPTAAPTAAPAKPGAGAEEIIVTATRREQTLQKVPIAVNAVTSEGLAKVHIENTAQLTRLVPNLNISSQVGAMVVYIRGVGQLATNPGQEPSVATYVDGIYQPTVFGSLTSLANVQRVEVIKGPQGTLFGRNATGGLVNIITRDPSQNSSGMMDVSYSNYNTITSSGYVTGGLASNVAADFAYYVNDQQHGFGHNIENGERYDGTRNIDIRSKLLFTPTDTTKIKIGGSYTNNSSAVGNDLAPLPGSVEFDGTTAPKNFYNINANLMPHNHNSTYQFSGKLEQEFEPFTFVAISAYTHTQDDELEDDDAAPTPLINAHLAQKDKFFTQELQLVSKKGERFNWILGAFYYHGDGQGTPSTGLSGLAFGNGLLEGFARLKTDSYAIYGEGTYEILPKLELTLGGRYTIDKKTLTGGTESFDSNGVQTSNSPLDKQKKTFKDPTYRAILNYHFTPDIMGYASYSRGFKSGGFDTGFPTGIAFSPETVDAFEGGFKTQLFDRKLTLNLAGFHYDYKNLQLPILINVDGVPSQVTLNAATAKVDGADVDGSLHLSRAFSANFGLGYLHSVYDKFLNAPCTSRTAAGATTQFACDASGNYTSHAPKWTYNVGGTYTIPSSIGDFAATGTWSYMSRFYYTPENRLYQKGYGLLTAQIGWTSPDKKISAHLFGENLLAKKYTIAQYAQAGIGDSYVAGTPRRYGIDLKFNF